jgi:hypothetical protein
VEINVHFFFLPREQICYDFWAFLGNGNYSYGCYGLHCERWAVGSPCSQLRHWSEPPSASLTVVRRAGCRRPPVSTVRGQMMQCSPNPPLTEVYAFMARRVQKASCIYRPWTDDPVLPQPPTHQGLCFWAYPALDACRWAALLERPTLPVPGVPLSTPSTVRGLLPLSVTGLRAFFYPRTLRPVRTSAPLRKATTARQPTAHTSVRPRPPLPTGPPSSLSHILSQRNARASTKQSTPGPQPRSRSLSGAKGSPGRHRPAGPP